MKILVTGGSGYKGSVLIPLLLKDGHEIVSIDSDWFGNNLVSHKNLITIKDLVSKIFSLNKLSIKEFVKVVAERPGKDKYYTLSSSKIRKEFNWQPKISLNEGLLKTKNWVSENLNKINKLSLTYEHKK